ncbi:hypothetical protein A2U01_0078806, partial [Trifolium medium]|nr:hypothetical protein [Trifolium medium]
MLKVCLLRVVQRVLRVAQINNEKVGCLARGATVPARGVEVVSRAARGTADLVYIRKICFLVP